MKRVTASLLALAVAAPAMAQTSPSDFKLHVAYCLGVFQVANARTGGETVARQCAVSMSQACDTKRAIVAGLQRLQEYLIVTMNPNTDNMAGEMIALNNGRQDAAASFDRNARCPTCEADPVLMEKGHRCGELLTELPF